MMKCASCGATLVESSTACLRCGNVRDTPVSEETIRLDTMAMAVPAAVTPRSGSASGTYSSRYQSMATEDEGRFLPGTLLAGRYRMIELLGRGGMGEVYRATDLTLAQSVALKFLPNAADSLRLIERFHNEVRIARQVSHPNVCRVYDIGEAEGMPFISMEYVDGEDLGSLLQRIGRLPCDKALDIARKLCAGIAAAHERGIIHRDLKPQNIMLNRRGDVVIMDFGLAAIADELRGIEARNGTPAYMSPEQLRGDAVTPKSDIYALGLLIYELFTGRRAFEARSLADLIKAQESYAPLSITTIAPDADPGVEKVVLRCLNPDPAQRPSSALAVAAALPGGDPLAAALAAGEMPSPELVAASGEAEGIPARYAIACLIILLVGIIVQPLVVRSASMLSLGPPEYQVPVLEQKARELAARLGHTPPAQDRISWFSSNSALIRYLREHLHGAKDWSSLLRAESPYRLHYRQSPMLLVSPPDGEITEDRPPLQVPGMLYIVLDGSGHLRNFTAVMSGREQTPQESARAEDVFRLAGLDLARFTEAEPRIAPAVPFDRRQAWIGSHPRLPNINIGVELATWRGVPVSFQLIWPFSKLPDEMEPAPELQQTIFQTFTVMFLLTGLFCTIYFARYNLRLGRGDRKGALILAGTLGTIMIAEYLLRGHYVPSLEMLGFTFRNVANVLAISGLVWLAYVALEPAVRAAWPQSLITWNRIFAGQWSDPRVCSHILVGATVGAVVHFGFLWRTVLGVQSGDAPISVDYRIYEGTRFLLARLLATFNEAVITSMVIFFVLCGLKALLRRDWLAALAASLLMTLQEGGIRESMRLGTDVPIYMAVFAVFAFMLLRMGMVPAVAGILTLNVLGKIQPGPDFLSWVNQVAVIQMIVLTLIVLWSFWRSQSSPPARRLGTS